MPSLPSSINDFMVKLVADTRSPALWLVANDGRLSEWGGDLAAYGIEDLRRDQPVGQQVFFLEGMLPLDTSPLFLPYMKTDSGLSADIYLFTGEEGTWVLLMDATWEARKRK